MLNLRIAYVTCMATYLKSSSPIKSKPLQFAKLTTDPISVAHLLIHLFVKLRIYSKHNIGLPTTSGGSGVFILGATGVATLSSWGGGTQLILSR